MIGNKNAERWTLEKAIDFMEKAIDLSRSDSYDFIGEVAYDLNEDKGVFDYIVTKYPELKQLKSRIKSNCEVNCFRNIKREKINVATGIINLKSNHGWTDRSENKNTNTNYNSEPLSKQEIKDINDSLEEEY